jgi:hypothetical protein
MFNKDLAGITLDGKNIFEHLGEPKFQMFQSVKVYGESGYIYGIAVTDWDVLYLPTKDSPNRAYQKEGELLRKPEWKYLVRQWDGKIIADAYEYELQSI